jgi:hypothetical protein
VNKIEGAHIFVFLYNCFLKSPNMRPLLSISIVLLLISCQTRQNSDPQQTTDTATINTSVQQEEPSPADTVATPEGFTKLKEAKGDLDKDNQDEMVIVYDTKKGTELGTERQLHIFKRGGNGWTLWHKSIGAVLPSEHGGMMGDPFEGIKIERGAIVIHHYGGSKDKWNYTHRYRYQNGVWELIGATINFGAPCETRENYDYNLVTGKIEAKIDTEACDDEGKQKESTQTEEFTFASKPAKPVLMDSFYPGDNEVKIKDRDKSFYY